MSAPDLRAVAGADAPPDAAAPAPARVSVDENRPVLMAVCEGLPLLLTADELDFTALLNTAKHYRYLIDPAAPLGEVPPAVYLAEHLLVRFGVDGAAGGKRAIGVVSSCRKYLVPFLVEVAWAKPSSLRGAAHLRLADAEDLPRILAGRRRLPAATVAALRLGGRRPALSCLHLDLADAAFVVAGGAAVLERAIADGRVPTYADARTGVTLVRPFDLRAAGLLIELDTPHGIAASSARNVLRELTAAFTRANTAGAGMVSAFRLEPLAPRTPDRMRDPAPRHGYVGLRDVRTMGPHLTVVAQVLLWLERLLGLRISESFGPLVGDFRRDETGRGWLTIVRQGGISMTDRDEHTGELVVVDHKRGTKTRAGEREIPLPHLLSDLIETVVAVFHTDPVSGEVDATARLAPGIGKDDASGQSTYRTKLETAQQAVGLSFRPHASRGALITDLKEAGIKKRVRYAYAGHETDNPDIQSRHYDQGVSAKKLLKVARVLDDLLASELGDPGPTGLIVPTVLREQWGRGTRIGALAGHVERQLTELGWWTVDHDPDRGAALDTKAAAARLELSTSEVKRLLERGELAGFKVAWGTREVWRVWEADVDAYRAARGRTLGDIAQETGWTYHQLWSLAEELGLGPSDRGHREAIRLDAADEERLIAAVEERENRASGTLTLGEAAGRLGMDSDDVAVLVDHAYLELADGHRPGAPRRVTVSSVEALAIARAERHPVEAAAGDGCTLLQAARLLGCDRRTVPHLVKAGVLVAATHRGRQHVSRDSVSRHAAHTAQVADRIGDQPTNSQPTN